MYGHMNKNLTVPAKGSGKFDKRMKTGIGERYALKGKSKASVADKKH